MNDMKTILLFMMATGIVMLSFLRCNAQKEENTSVLLVSGGHDFEEDLFYDVFDSLQNITYDTATQPRGNELIASPSVNNYDVLVFYDMYDSITAAQQKAYTNLLNKGKAMIFLHHALVSYQHWEEFKNIIGGKYYQTAQIVNGDTLKSTYEHDLTIPVKVEDTTHPVTSGIQDFEIFDEIYGHCEILPTVEPLLSTSYAESIPYLAWINPYGNSDVLYIQLGHGPEAYANPNYRKLIQQVIHWSAKQHSPE